MNKNDHFKKKNFSIKRFGVELSIFIFLVLCILFFFKNTGNLFFGLIIFLAYTILGLFFNQLLVPIQFLFNKIFYLISKITNPMLLFFVYILGIFLPGILYKIYALFKKKKQIKWTNCNIDVKSIDLDNQF
jgi:ABC-type multidrug transport system permease subunit